MHSLILMLAFAAVLAGCATVESRPSQTGAEPVSQTDVATPAMPAVRTDLFGEPGAVQEPERIFQLSDEQQADFLEFFHDPDNAHHEPHFRIYKFLEDHLQNFTYYEQTLSARESLDIMRGNCMSLAVATTALARIAEIDFSYQRANSAPVFARSSATITSSDHIRTRLYDPGYTREPGRITITRPHIVIDYFTNLPGVGGTTVGKDEFIAMYYRNLAAEALIEGNLDASFRLLMAALEQDPGNRSVLNTLAVVHRRAGASDTAEALLQYLLDLHGEDLNVLHNYRSLLLAQQRPAEAQAMFERILNLPDADPYQWMEMADMAQRSEDLAAALAYYRKTVELAPYLHEAWLAMAVVYHDLGRQRPAAQALARALENARNPDTRNLYQAKLWSLTQ